MGWAQVVFLFFTTVSAYAVAIPERRSILNPAISDAGSSDGHGSFTLTSRFPCHSCQLPTKDNTVIVDLEVLSSDRECGSKNTILVNEQPQAFTSDWRHFEQRLTRFHASLSSDPTTQVLVEAYIQLACLDGDTSILALKVVRLNSISTPVSQGFTVSFRQRGYARLIKHDVSPISVQLTQFGPEWSHEATLEEEYRKLELIEANIEQMKAEYHRQQSRIKNIVVDEFKSCNDWMCYFTTAKTKAPYLTTLIKTLFCPDGKSDLQTSAPGQLLISSSQSHDSVIPQAHDGSVVKLSEQDEPSASAELHPPSPIGVETSQTLPVTTSSDLINFSTEQAGPVYLSRQNAPILISIAATIVIAVTLFGIAKVVKAKTNLFDHRRWKQDWTARREEQRTRAAYRRAACRQRMKRWWTNFRQPAVLPTSNYEEKRARILSQENILENAMQNEITHIQRAQEIAIDMTRGEECRQRMYYEANYGQLMPPSYPQSYAHRYSTPYSLPPTTFSNTPTLLNSSINSTHTNTFTYNSNSTRPTSLYSGPPPSYAADLNAEAEMTIVDGFHYTPSNSDNTTESSVVDCTSEMSFDTGSLT